MALTKEDLQAISELLKPVTSELQSVKDKVTGIELTLENETNRNIQIIAEGHLDLSRKLDKALKVENELRKVKDRLSQIA